MVINILHTKHNNKLEKKLRNYIYAIGQSKMQKNFIRVRENDFNYIIGLHRLNSFP